MHVVEKQSESLVRFVLLVNDQVLPQRMRQDATTNFIGGVFRHKK